MNPFRQPFDRRLLVPPDTGGGNLGIPWIGNGFIAGILTD